MSSVRIYQVLDVVVYTAGADTKQIAFEVAGVPLSMGWHNASLQLVGDALSADGILELEMLAHPPAGGPVRNAARYPLTANLVWEGDPEKLVGVSIHARTNVLTRVFHHPWQRRRVGVAGRVTAARLGGFDESDTTLELGEDAPSHESEDPPTLGEEGSEDPPTMSAADAETPTVLEDPPTALEDPPTEAEDPPTATEEPPSGDGEEQPTFDEQPSDPLVEAGSLPAFEEPSNLASENPTVPAVENPSSPWENDPGSWPGPFEDLPRRLGRPAQNADASRLHGGQQRGRAPRAVPPGAAFGQWSGWDLVWWQGRWYRVPTAQAAQFILSSGRQARGPSRG